MRSLFRLLTIIPVTAIILVSCQKDEEFPPEPSIEFSDFVFYGTDSAEFRINFTDGDGDIGLAQNDTFPPYDDSSIYYNNIFLTYKYFDTVSQSFKVYYISPNPPDSEIFSYNYRIPRIENIGQNKTLRGEIIVKLPGKGLLYIPGHTRWKYECFIVDRALHESNRVESPEYYP